MAKAFLDIEKMRTLLDDPNPPHGAFLCLKCHRPIDPAIAVEYETLYCGIGDCYGWDIKSLKRLILPRMAQGRPPGFMERDWQVLELYYGESMIMKDIGVRLGVSTNRVRQILCRAIERLAHA